MDKPEAAVALGGGGQEAWHGYSAGAWGALPGVCPPLPLALLRGPKAQPSHRPASWLEAKQDLALQVCGGGRHLGSTWQLATNTGCRWHHKGSQSATEEQEKEPRRHQLSGSPACCPPAFAGPHAGFLLRTDASGSELRRCFLFPASHVFQNRIPWFSFRFPFLSPPILPGIQFHHHHSFPLTFKMFPSSLPSYYKESVALMLLSPSSTIRAPSLSASLTLPLWGVSLCPFHHRYCSLLLSTACSCSPAPGTGPVRAVSPVLTLTERPMATVFSRPYILALKRRWPPAVRLPPGTVCFSDELHVGGYQGCILDLSSPLLLVEASAQVPTSVRCPFSLYFITPPSWKMYFFFFQTS